MRGGILSVSEIYPIKWKTKTVPEVPTFVPQRTLGPGPQVTGDIRDHIRTSLIDSLTHYNLSKHFTVHGLRVLMLTLFKPV